MARSNLPKFGNWECEENVPYTAYFDKARKVRAPGSKIMNPNDPEENPDLQSQSQPPSHSRTKPEGSGGSSTEANNKRQGRTAATATTTTTSAPVSLNNSCEKSPLHHSQAKDGHKNSYDGTARSKPKPNLRADENPKKVTVVPKFGDWDENNPASADGYTHIFNKVREERSSAANMPKSSRSPSYPNGGKPPNSSCCCFGFRGN